MRSTKIYKFGAKKIMNMLITVVFLITIWINVPDFTNTINTTEQVKSIK